jgi:hypothetical protein
LQRTHSAGCSCYDGEDGEDEPEPEGLEPEPEAAVTDEPEPEAEGLLKPGQLARTRSQQMAALNLNLRLNNPPAPAADGYSMGSLPYLCHLTDSPVLFTAPHGLRFRKGAARGRAGLQCARNHARERWSTEIALKLSQAFAMRASPGAMSAGGSGTVKPASFMVWNYRTARVRDSGNLDPNYLDKEAVLHAPWHSCLHAWRASAAPRWQESDGDDAMRSRRPKLLHIDIHGKMDRKTQLDLDVGLGPMEYEWDEDAAEPLKAQLDASLGQALAGKTLFNPNPRARRKMELTVELDPVLNGFWGSGTVMTISHQSVLLGIPALQLEIPYTLRQALMAKDQVLFDRFSRALFEVVDFVVANGVDATELYDASSGESTSPLADHGGTRELCELTLAPATFGLAEVDKMLADLAKDDDERTHTKMI